MIYADDDLEIIISKFDLMERLSSRIYDISR